MSEAHHCILSNAKVCGTGVIMADWAQKVVAEWGRLAYLLTYSYLYSQEIDIYIAYDTYD